MARRINGAVRVEWRDRLRRFQCRSGSVEAFCRLEGGSIGALYQWRRRLGGVGRAGGVSPTASAEGLTRPPPQKTAASPSVRHLSSPDGNFAALTLRSVDSQISPVCVLLPDGTRIEVPAADPRLVRLMMRCLVRTPDSRCGVS